MDLEKEMNTDSASNGSTVATTIEELPTSVLETVGGGFHVCGLIRIDK